MNFVLVTFSQKILIVKNKLTIKKLTLLHAPCLQKGHVKVLHNSRLIGFFEGSQ